MTTYRAYCKHTGWLILTPSGYGIDAQFNEATTLPLERLQAAATHHQIADVVFIPADLTGVAAQDLMLLAGDCMKAATDMANARIAPVGTAKTTICSSCGENAVITELITGTNPARYTRICSACGTEN